MLNERIEDHLPVHLIETATGALRVSNASHLETKPMLSRTADHLFWMARYMERAENTPACSTSITRPRCCRSRVKPPCKAGRAC